jgi:hypothetical protein
MKVDNCTGATRKDASRTQSASTKSECKALYIKLFTVWKAFLRETIKERLPTQTKRRLTSCLFPWNVILVSVLSPLKKEESGSLRKL